VIDPASPAPAESSAESSAVPNAGAPDPGRRRFVVCGNNPLAYRLAAELASQPDRDVTVIVRAASARLGPLIAELPGIRMIEATELNAAAFEAAEVDLAEALALTDQDDVANIHAALRAQEVNPGLRLVVRFFNMSLGYRIQELFPGSAVLSDSSTAAPAFVAAALGEVAPGSARLPGRPRRTVFVARRGDVAESRVVCGLADTTAEGGPLRLPDDQRSADLVLALAGDEDVRLRAGRRNRGIRRRRVRRWTDSVRLVFTRKLALAAVLLLALLGVGTVGFAVLTKVSWPDAVYLTVLDAAGAAQPDPTMPVAAKIVQSVITLIGIAIIPVVTAAVVDSLVSARLATASGLPRRVSGHVVLVGLGNVGARVLSQLHELGVPMVAVDSDPAARGISRARRLGVPVVIGDASKEDVLREAHLGQARTLVAVTDNDVTNLEAALHGRAMCAERSAGGSSVGAELRVVLRLFDDDLARRVEQTFGIEVSRSVSFLAAPNFVAAMLQRQVLATIAVGRQVLLLAELPVQPGSSLVGEPLGAIGVSGRSRVVALQPHTVETLRLLPPVEHRLVGGDRLVVVATPAGLSELSARAGRRV
jgi:Trk K+ transport system NAD-binding subunit